MPVHKHLAEAEAEAVAEAVPEPAAEALRTSMLSSATMLTLHTVPSDVDGEPSGEERSDPALRRRRVASTPDQRI